LRGFTTQVSTRSISRPVVAAFKFIASHASSTRRRVLVFAVLAKLFLFQHPKRFAGEIFAVHFLQVEDVLQLVAATRQLNGEPEGLPHNAAKFSDIALRRQARLPCLRKHRDTDTPPKSWSGYSSPFQGHSKWAPAATAE